jgi:predicted Zn finger-like uncharacterized protein
MSMIESATWPRSPAADSSPTWPSASSTASEVVSGELMDVRCETCGTEYEFDAARIGPQGVKVKCTACQFVFVVYSNSQTSARPSKNNWLVRTVNDRLIAFEKLTTLQKWIIEGRVEREDEISKDQTSWKRLGNVAELNPFFAVFDRASALNDLMNTGAVGDHPILVNGSEILATANPLNTGRPSSNLPQALVETLAVPVAVRRPSSIGPAIALAPTAHPASFANDASEAGTNPDHEVSLRKSAAPELETGWAGPAALDHIEQIDDLEADEFVHSFERKSRRTRRVLAVGSLLIGGLIGGAAFALYGFPQSPISKIKEWQTQEKSNRPASQNLIETARQQLEKDSLKSIEAANKTYLRALKDTPKQVDLLAERALVLTIWADSLRRKARNAEAKTPPSESKARESLADEINAARSQASSLTQEAFVLLRHASESSGQDIKTLRALADYYRVQRDEKVHDYLIQAKALAQAKEARDPLTMYIEAATMTMDLSMKSPAEREQAARLLEDVLTLRPTLIRARVLLARVLAAQGSSTLAQENIRRVLLESPDHEEAQEILKQLEAESANALKKTPSKEEPPDAELIASKPSKMSAESKTALAKSKETSAEKGYKYYLDKGRALRRRNDPWKALHAFEKASRLRKSAAAPYVGIGWCYLELGKPIAAQNQFKKATMVKATSLEAQHGRGMALVGQGKIEEALPYLERVIDWAPNSRAARKARKTIEEIDATE